MGHFSRCMLDRPKLGQVSYIERIVKIADALEAGGCQLNPAEMELARLVFDAEGTLSEEQLCVLERRLFP